MPPEVAEIRQRLRIEDYVLLYDDMRKIGVCFLLAFMEPKELKTWTQELEALSQEDQQKRLNEFATDLQEMGELMDVLFHIPKSEKERIEARRAFEALAEDEKKAATRFAQFMWLGFLTCFHSIVSVMVHGETLTSLVAKAIAGDDEAYCKAIQIDRQIYTHHPYFRERISRATAEQDAAFLTRVSYRLQARAAKGKIQHPDIWVVLSILDSLGWLDGSLTANQILDLCDDARLNRHDNRVESETALHKIIRRYRKMQKTSLLSSH